LSYKDTQFFSKDRIVIINGEEQIHGNREKTGVPYVIFLLPQAKEILERYDYRLPEISNQKYNDYLKLLMGYTGIDKDVTTHSGRHTFGTCLINKGVSIEAIPKIMGHTNMKQSFLYARMLGVTAINEMKKLLGTDETQDEDEENES
jgi:integrase